MTRGRALAMLALLALGLATGCVGSRWMRGQAFVPPLRHYRIRYDDVSRHAVLPAGWRVTNQDGAGVRPGEPWWTRGEVELAEGSRQLVSRPRFDLYAEHHDDGATIFVRTMPISFALAPRSLQSLAHSLVESSIGEGFLLVRGSRAGGVEMREGRIVDEAPALVGDTDAYDITVEVAVTGSRRLGSRARVRLVLFRPGAWRWRTSDTATTEGAPMLVVAGYASSAERFDAHVGDLEALLSRLDVRPTAP